MKEQLQAGTCLKLSSEKVSFGSVHPEVQQPWHTNSFSPSSSSVTAREK